MKCSQNTAAVCEIRNAECPPSTIIFDVSLIPPHVRDDLSRFALALVKECFSQPGAEERYQAWLSERKKVNEC